MFFFLLGFVFDSWRSARFLFLLWTSPSITFELSVCEAERPSFVRLPWRPGPAGRGRCVSCNRFISFFLCVIFFSASPSFSSPSRIVSGSSSFFFRNLLFLCVCIFCETPSRKRNCVEPPKKKKEERKQFQPISVDLLDVPASSISKENPRRRKGDPWGAFNVCSETKIGVDFLTAKQKVRPI